MKLLQPQFAHVSRPAIRTFTLLAVLLLVLPTLSLAQTVKPADLMGEWAKKGEKAVHMTFKIDNTYKVQGVTARWHLAGDTLVTDSIISNGDAQEYNLNDLRRLVKFKDQELTFTKVDGTVTGTYVRVGPSKSEPAKPKD